MIRRLSAFVIAAAAICLLPATASGSFTLGVTAGEVKTKSARLWAHSTKSGTAKLEVATDRRFRHVAEEKNVKAKSSHDDTLQTTVRGLDPGEHYFFRFTMGNKRSKVGQFDTAPRSSSSAKVTFAWSGDTDAQPAPGSSNPFYNNFEVYKRMLGEDNDFNVNFGDTIYSDSEVPGTGAPALTKQQKWAKYQQNLELKNLQKLRGGAGLYSHWDDHEFINDFSIPEHGVGVYKAGVAAFRDYAPVTFSNRRGLYRTFRWGKNVELFFLDERSFRDAKASANHTCDNPQTGQPDLAPTAPQSTRNKFAVLVPSLAQPVSQACKDKINDPNRDFLGAAQLKQFADDVKSSNARFKVIMNELPIQQLYALPYDNWQGYEADRQRVLTFLKNNVDNVIFLTTDVHSTLVGDARFKTLEQGGPVPSGILDVTVGPVATMTYQKEINGTTGNQSAGPAVDGAFFEPAPPDGLGLQCSVLDKFSYGEVTVTKKKLLVELKGINGKALTDEDDKACPKFTVK